MNQGNPCDVALDYLEHIEVKPVGKYFPQGSASFYVPARKIKELFEDEPNALTLESMFLCPCSRCERDGGSVDDRWECFNKLREQELRGDYALIYALLIYIRRPGLIRIFQKHELKLQGTMYLRDSDFETLNREHIHNLDVLRRKVVEKQYSFLVRTLRPFPDITAISSNELLPISEDPEPKGTGTFAEVRCFGFQDDDYRSREFGEYITRFARKIFKQGMDKPAAKEWNNLQKLSKEEDHPHLMDALGAYRHGNQFFILQEEAEQPLHDYLKGEGDEFESKELWKQMKGVTDALNTLHKLYKGTKIAYHQDLKPANILIVRRKFKIADFGLLEFKPPSLPGDSGSTGVTNAHNTGYYAAPRQYKYTRDSDIWSLGCIMSEVATCDIQGRDGVKDYKEARIANSPSARDTPRFYNGQTVKDSVLKRHKELYSFVSEVPADRDAASKQFQGKFYTREFFDLLNSMFKATGNPTNFLQVAMGTAVPDAGHIVETIERLCKAAMPASALDNRVETFGFDKHLDLQLLNSLYTVHLTSFKEVLNKKNTTIFPVATLAGLKRCIVSLQAKQHAERRLQGLSRLALFLERFEQFGGMIKNVPGVAEFMGYIWGPAKFLLEVTGGRADALGDLLDIYGQVGRSQPSMTMYEEFFVTKPDLTQILSATYDDMVQLNRWLVIYFQQRLWKDLYDTTWRRHKTRIVSIMSRMASRLDLIVSRASVAQFDSFLNASALENERLLATVDGENLSRRQAVHARLRPTDMENEQYSLARVRAECPGTCRWLLSDETFKRWFDPECTDTAVPKLLWVNGKPGSGKTVLASMVVEEARKLEPSHIVLFFYFMLEDSDRNDYVAMARTLLMQILEQNPYSLDYFYSKCCISGGALLTSRTLIEELLTFAMGNCESVYIVLDGLDECRSRKERGEIVSWFREMIENLPSDASDRIRCLFVSQHDSARKDYRDLPSITLDANKNEGDIELFSNKQSERLVIKFGISEKEAKDIAASVCISAEGIFLFAHLVWVNLCGQSSIHGLQREIASFPTDLDKLDKIYARIMQTIVNKPVRAEREEALMLLGWLVCAKRSLKMHEIQMMKSIDLDSRAIEFERRRFRVSPKELCESLVEVREDGTIELVHMTAKSYLANCAYLDIATEELRLATLCINYLNLPSFRVPCSEQAVLAGEYGFMEYAMIHWLRHLEAGLISSSSRQYEFHEDLAESLEVLVEQHWNDPPTADINSIPECTQEMLRVFSGRQKYLQIQLAVGLTDRDLKYLGALRPEQFALDFAGIVLEVRSHLETVVRNNPSEGTTNDLQLRYGTHLFKCPRFSCKYFTEGFSTPDEREKHLERHERPARCTDEHCRGSKIGFANKSQLERHLRATNPGLEQRLQDFPTEEEIIESVRENLPEPAAEAEAQPQPNPELPGPSFGAERAIAPSENYKRQKCGQNFQCEHCGKSFNKKFNWQSHLASHGADPRFKCQHCSMTCARRGDLVRHMKLHDPDIAVTCSGCGERFSRADTLRSHYKSHKGKQCIAGRDSEDQANM